MVWVELLRGEGGVPVRFSMGAMIVWSRAGWLFSFLPFVFLSLGLTCMVKIPRGFNWLIGESLGCWIGERVRSVGRRGAPVGGLFFPLPFSLSLLRRCD